MLHNEMLRDKLVLGCHTRDKGPRTRLFWEKDCDLQKVLEMLQISEATQEQLKQIGSKEQEIQSRKPRDLRCVTCTSMYENSPQTQAWGQDETKQQRRQVATYHVNIVETNM